METTMKKFMAIMAAMVMALSLTACSDEAEKINPDENVIKVEEITINDIEINTTDKDVVIEYTLLPEGAEGEVTFTVADETVATVVEGKLTAVAEGETELTVSVDEISKTVSVVVKAEEVPHGEDGEEAVEGDNVEAGTEVKDEVEIVKPVQSTEPAATPTPVATPKPTEAAKCGSVGHTADGTCSVCGSSYTTPKCGSVGHTADGTCSVCGSSYTAPKCGAVGHSADGTCSVCGSSYTTPKCGATGHSSEGTCSVCGSNYTAPKLDNNEKHVLGAKPGDNGAGDVFEE